MQRREDEDIFDRALRVLRGSLILQLTIFLIMAALGSFMIYQSRRYAPIEREGAESYVGSFEEYRSEDRVLAFSDGVEYRLFPVTATDELETALNGLEKGTELRLLVNPKIDDVIEIRTATEYLLDFDGSQAAIYADRKDLFWIGVMFIGLPLILLLLLQIERIGKKKEKKRQRVRDGRAKKQKFRGKGTPPLRDADMTKRGRILLEATKDKYEIVYRRLKKVNELIVNGRVYDEMKAVLEVEHTLSAEIDGHKIEAGLQEIGTISFIRFDGETLAEKRRVI